MPRRTHLLLPLLLALSGVASASGRDHVDPFIGTDQMGHTFPGAAAPFGLVQLSPETDLVPYSLGDGYNRDAYRYCAGYQYGDSTIVGFAHTHFSGTGHGDLGDVLLMPTVGALQLDPGPSDHPERGYRSRFSHAEEQASPGYYRVHLLDPDVTAELTATERVGVHRYTFPAAAEAHLVLDLTANIYDFPGKTVWSSVRMESDTLLTGWRQTTGWARTRTVYFALALSKPIASYGLRNEEDSPYRGFWRKFDQDHGFPERAGRRLKCHLDFATAAGEPVMVKVALSGVSVAGALRNLAAEAPGWDFDAIREATARRWADELDLVQVDAAPDVLTSFYTSLYHAFLAPVVYGDVDGRYRGLDQEIHLAGGWTDYTVFSLWDTYRAEHPLLTLLQPDRTRDMVRSLLAHQQQSVHHVLPVWSHHANENWCMIGYHSVPVIADAYLKGLLEGVDADQALDAMIASATYRPYDGLGDYLDLGWVPADRQSSSASKTLEYAYDDWTIARMAEAMGRRDVAEEFFDRAGNWRHLFDDGTGFLRARNADGSFPAGFDPMATDGQGYIEGNAWNYSLYVPHDVAGFIDLLGGPARLDAWVDGLFDMEVSDADIAHNEDITRAGMIGNYVHGNEPSHHVPYLPCFTGSPWKAQVRIRQILREMYRPGAAGLCGNDDCGQMSAWYVFSALGFYPVAPGSDQYVLGSPCVDRAVVELGRGRTLSVVAENQGPDHVYVQAVTLNGLAVERNYLTHAELMAGGELRFVMGPVANRSRGTSAAAAPFSMSRP
ncbi:MAG: GH92 family glycosyl hydrolase [Candidatus Krumholzibacteriia bacterium]